MALLMKMKIVPLQRSCWHTSNVLFAVVRNSTLSQSVYRHVGQQFQDCKTLSLLDLGKLDDNPMEIIRAISEMHSLKYLLINNCMCETQTFIALAEILRSCKDHLVVLYLLSITGISAEFAETLSKVTSVKVLGLQNCRMTPSTRKVVMQALPNYAQLKILDLGGNILTDCIADFLSVDNHRGFCDLIKLDLSATKLSRDDLGNLGTALSSGKLPKISDLILSSNNLRNCVRLLFTSSPITSLQRLALKGTSLNKSDVTYLSQVVENKRLPELKDLDLRSNNLGSMEDETKILLLSCVGQYAEIQFDLDVGENDLSDVFQDEAAALCFGTKIKLTPLSVSRSFDIMREFLSIFPVDM